MKSLSLILSYLAVVVVAVATPPARNGPQQVTPVRSMIKRQLDVAALAGSLMGGNPNPNGSKPWDSIIPLMMKAPSKIEKLAPLIRSDATRQRMWYGPFTLPEASAPRLRGLPLQMDPSGIQFTGAISGFCSDCTVLYGKGTVHFEDGTRATAETGVYEHHVVVVDMMKSFNGGQKFILCNPPESWLSMIPAVGFIVSGNDEAANYHTTPNGKFNSGYIINGTNKAGVMGIQAELVNYRPEKQKIYLVMEYEWLKGQPESPADSSVSLFSVTGCKPPDYHPKDRVYNMTSDSFTMKKNGFLINMKGHLHDGGDHIVLKVNDKVVCDSKAIYSKDTRGPGASGHSHGRRSAESPTRPAEENWEVITEMTQCTEPVAVRKGDNLSMTSFYDGVKHPPRPTKDTTGQHVEADEMGVYFINFAASDKPIEQLQVKSSKVISTGKAL